MLFLSTPLILQRLKEQDLHLGLSTTDRWPTKLTRCFLYSPKRYVLVAGEQASLPRQLSWAEIAELPLCLLSQDMQNRQTLDEIFRELGAAPNIVWRTTQSVLSWPNH